MIRHTGLSRLLWWANAGVWWCCINITLFPVCIQLATPPFKTTHTDFPVFDNLEPTPLKVNSTIFFYWKQETFGQTGQPIPWKEPFRQKGQPDYSEHKPFRQNDNQVLEQKHFRVHQFFCFVQSNFKLSLHFLIQDRTGRLYFDDKILPCLFNCDTVSRFYI